VSERDLQRINEALAVIGGLLTIVVMTRILLGPDAVTRLCMRSCLVVSHTAKRVADTATHVAGSADTAYHRMRNVTV